MEDSDDTRLVEWISSKEDDEARDEQWMGLRLMLGGERLK